jgi:hypothetical protein
VLLPESSAFEVELAIEKLKSHKSSGTGPIPAELSEAGGRTIHYEIHKLNISICDNEELPEAWKKSIIAHTYKYGNKTGCSKYRGTSLLPVTYKILSNIMPSITDAFCFDTTKTRFCQCNFTTKI